MSASDLLIQSQEQKPRQIRTSEELETIIEHYRALEDVSPDCVFIVDWELIVRYVNRSAARFMKRDVRAMTGKYLRLFFPPATYQTYVRRLHQVFRTGTEAISTDRIFLFGIEFVLNTKWVPVKDRAGSISAVIFIARDLSGLGQQDKPEGAPDESMVLSAREAQVLALIADGMTNKEIGQALFISPKTVDAHRTRIMKKLDAHNTAELILRSRQTGLLD